MRDGFGAYRHNRLAQLLERAPGCWELSETGFRWIGPEWPPEPRQMRLRFKPPTPEYKEQLDLLKAANKAVFEKAKDKRRLKNALKKAAPFKRRLRSY